MAETERKQDEKLGTAPLGRLIFSLAIPAVIAQLINVVYNLVDRIYIGHIPDVGAQALTGLGLSLPVILLIQAFSALAGMARRRLPSNWEKETGMRRRKYSETA